MAKRKVRLDQLLVQRGLAETRAKAQALILAGEVRVDGTARTKAGEQVAEDADLAVVGGLPYASRGGYKLAHALDAFGLSPAGLVALDVGASTGGFTDVLLQRGAGLVYAIDVGYGLLDWRLRQDPRVIAVDRTNIRYLESLPSEPANDQRPTTNDLETRRQGEEETRRQEDKKTGEREWSPNLQSPISNLRSPDESETQNSKLKTQNSVLADCATIDVAFISLRLVLPAVQRLITPEAWVVALVKPQFEAGAEQVGKGGVVRDPAIHAEVLRQVLSFAVQLGLAPHGLARSPITGPAGNVEFLAWLGGAGPTLDVGRAIDAALNR